MVAKKIKGVVKMSFEKATTSTSKHMKKAIAMLLAMMLMFSTMSLAFASGSAASVALTNAQQAIGAISSTNISDRQAAIDVAVDAINDAVDEINQILTEVGDAIESANDAIEAAEVAAGVVSAANTAAEAALAAAAANETAFNTSVTSFITNQPHAEASALLALENAVTAAWNAYAAAQNQANALANAAAEAMGTGATAAQVEAAIAQAEAAQVAANALLQAWLNAEVNLELNIDSTLATVAANRQQTRNNAATAHKAAVEALVAEAEALMDMQAAVNNANAIIEAQANVQEYAAQLDQLIAALDALNLHGYTHIIPGGAGAGTFRISDANAEALQLSPDPELPLHWTYITEVRRLAFRPDLLNSAWPAHIPRNMLQWNNAITFWVESASQSSLGAGAGQIGAGAEHVSLAEGDRLMMVDAGGNPIRFNYTDAPVTILIEIAFWCPTANDFISQQFWATGELENTASGTVNIRSLVPATDITITLSVGEIDELIEIDELNVAGLFEFELGNLFMAITRSLTEPPVLTGTVTCDETGRPIPGVTVYLYDDEGNRIGYRVTDEDGFFDFGEVPVGDLVVRINPETIPEGYVVIGGYYRTLTTVPGGVYEAHFYIIPEGEYPYLPTPPTPPFFPLPPIILPPPSAPDLGAPPPSTLPYIPWQPWQSGTPSYTPVVGEDPQPGDVLYTVYEPIIISQLPVYTTVAQADLLAPDVAYVAYDDPTDAPGTPDTARRVNPQTFDGSVMSIPALIVSVSVLALVGVLLSLGAFRTFKKKEAAK